MFYLMMHSTHFIYGVRHKVMDNSDNERENPLPPFDRQLAARDLLCAPSQRQDSTYHSVSYTSCGALAAMTFDGKKGNTC